MFLLPRHLSPFLRLRPSSFLLLCSLNSESGSEFWHPQKCNGSRKKKIDRERREERKKERESAELWKVGVSASGSALNSWRLLLVANGGVLSWAVCFAS